MCAIDFNDIPYCCFGSNNQEQLGDGTTIAKTTPTLVGVVSYKIVCDDGFILETTTGRCYKNKQ